MSKDNIQTETSKRKNETYRSKHANPHAAENQVQLTVSLPYSWSSVSADVTKLMVQYYRIYFENIPHISGHAVQIYRSSQLHSDIQTKREI